MKTYQVRSRGGERSREVVTAFEIDFHLGYLSIPEGTAEGMMDCTSFLTILRLLGPRVRKTSFRVETSKGCTLGVKVNQYAASELVWR